MCVFDKLRPYLPAEWVDVLAALPPSQQDAVQEVRLRAGQPLRLSTPQGEWYVSFQGMTALRQPNILVCNKEQLEECFLRFCEDSIYAHQNELEQGFLTVEGGIRVGLAGTVAANGVKVNALQDINSLCIRLPREHRGCAVPLLPCLMDSGVVISTLLVGEPASGKTSLLRDAAAGLAARGLRVTVVDERGELSGVNGLMGCDVLRGCPKAAGIQQAVRCLAPQVIVFDELGDEEEMRAVIAGAHAGVAVISSLHGHRPEEVVHRPLVRELVRQRVFDRWVFLKGRGKPGTFTDCLSPEVSMNEIYWHPAGAGGRRRDGDVLFPSFISAG
ncbi:MAG: hypothetical protein IIW40_01505 [Clostridia bacterium]|nr:hypothetical protein [Clostridia bacterium]